MFSKLIIEWYHHHKRDLPWRHTTDAYTIWVSEIILQQTRVDQGLQYFIRFINRFPTVVVLAMANEDDVLKIWQGLGYYTRARNMHKAAKLVVSNFNGIFPTSYYTLLTLPGIGAYTAAAISSFSANEKFAVLDGNVFRVLSRYFGIFTPIDSNEGKKEFINLAQKMLDTKNASDYNQAIMEFGALQCLPQKPICINCPLKHDCYALKHGVENELPIKIKKNFTKTRYFYYLDIRNKDYRYLQQRKNSDIWKHLFEFPLIESLNNITIEDFLSSQELIDLCSGCGEIVINKVSNEIKHILTHQTIIARFIEISIQNENSFLKNLIKIKNREIEQYPVSRLMHKYLEQNM